LAAEADREKGALQAQLESLTTKVEEHAALQREVLTAQQHAKQLAAANEDLSS